MPTIDIPDKICPHCGGTRWFIHKQGKYTHHSCILRRKENLVKFHESNPEKRKVYKKKCDRQKSIRLTNSYLKELIIGGTNLSFKDIPQELVEIKRKELLLKKQIKNNGKS